MGKKNNDVIDLTKFILSAFVVAIHAQLFHEYIYPFVRLAVPMFFILSGYFAFANLDPIQDKLEKKRKMLCITQRFLKLYLFWFILLLPYTLYLRKYFDEGFFHGMLIMIQNFFLGSTFRGSWYIMATILGIIIIYGLSGRMSNASLLLVTVPIYLYATVFTEFSAEIQSVPALRTISNGYERIFGTPCFTFLIALLYIALGKIIADCPPEKRKCSKYTVLFVVCLLGLLLEYGLRRRNAAFPFDCDCLIMLAPTAFFFVMSIFNVQIAVKNAKVMRKLSTVIYCSHMVMLAVVSKALQIAHISDSVNILKYLLTLAVTACLGLVILKLEKVRGLRFLRYSH